MNINVFMLLTNVCTEYHETEYHSMKFCGNFQYGFSYKRENLKNTETLLRSR
jgi:hypothetical protein